VRPGVALNLTDASVTTAVADFLLGLAANAALVVGSFWIARDGLRSARGLATVLASVVVFWSGCTLGLELLGTLCSLSVAAMAAWGSAACALGLALKLRRGAPAGIEAACSSREPLSWDGRLALAATAAAASMLCLRSLLLGVKVVSDGPIYHLLFAAKWWKAGRLILVPTPFGETAATYFPANGDLWLTWLMASWGGDRLAKVAQAPFWIVAALAAYGCARSIGAGLRASLVATCWFATVTPLVLFSFEPNVDTIFVAGYLVAVYFILQAAERDWDARMLALAGLAAGQAFGSKAVGIVFVVPLWLGTILAIMLSSAPVRAKLFDAIVLTAAILVTGSYWFVRNALLAANPLYPLKVDVLNRPFLSGWYGPDAMRASPYYLPFDDWRALGDTLLAVSDPRLAPIWLFALGSGWALARAASPSSRRRVAILSLLAVLNVAIFWVMIPYRTQQRFMLHALGLAVVPLAVVLDRLSWLRRVAVLLLLLHVFTPECWPFALREDHVPWDLTPNIPNAIGAPIPLLGRLAAVFRGDPSLDSLLSMLILLTICATAVMTIWAWDRAVSRPIRRWRNSLIALALTAALLLVGYFDTRARAFDRRFDFYPFYTDFLRGWLELEARSGPSGSRVAYAGTNLPYYLMGIGLRNDVRYVNINRHLGWLMHDYHREAMKQGAGTWPSSRPAWDRIHPDFDAWLANLDAERIQLLVVTRVNLAEGVFNAADSETFPIERRWADTHPDRFELLYGARENDRSFRLYRLRPKVAAGSVAP
jgi:hypothetical protein